MMVDLGLEENLKSNDCLAMGLNIYNGLVAKKNVMDVSSISIVLR